jgi:hypothetical protein
MLIFYKKLYFYLYLPYIVVYLKEKIMKKLGIFIGLASVIGVGYYLFKKSKNKSKKPLSNTSNKSSVDSSPVDSSPVSTSPVSTSPVDSSLGLTPTTTTKPKGGLSGIIEKAKAQAQAKAQANSNAGTTKPKGGLSGIIEKAKAQAQAKAQANSNAGTTKPKGGVFGKAISATRATSKVTTGAISATMKAKKAPRLFGKAVTGLKGIF